MQAISIARRTANLNTAIYGGSANPTATIPPGVHVTSVPSRPVPVGPSHHTFNFNPLRHFSAPPFNRRPVPLFSFGGPGEQTFTVE